MYFSREIKDTHHTLEVFRFPCQQNEQEGGISKVLTRSIVLCKMEFPVRHLGVPSRSGLKRLFQGLRSNQLILLDVLKLSR